MDDIEIALHLKSVTSRAKEHGGCSTPPTFIEQHALFEAVEQLWEWHMDTKERPYEGG